MVVERRQGWDVWINTNKRSRRGTGWLYRGDRVVDAVAKRRVSSVKP